MSGASRYEVFPGRGLVRRGWRFRLIASNGEQVGRDSQLYPGRSGKEHAVDGAKAHQQASADAEIVVVER